jgi:hypothetical protein
VTIRASWIRENRRLSASEVLGLADNRRDSLRSLRLSASYIFDGTWSITGGRFSTTGSADATLYGTANGSPNTSVWIAEVAYLPFMQAALHSGRG